MSEQDLVERLQKVLEVLSLIKDYLEQTEEVVFSIKKDLELIK